MQVRLADRCVTGIDPGGRLDLDMELWASAAQTSLPLELRTLGTCVSRTGGYLGVERGILFWVRCHSQNALTPCGIPCNILTLSKSWKPLLDLGFGCS